MRSFLLPAQLVIVRMCGQHQQQVVKAAWKQVHELEVEPFS